MGAVWLHSFACRKTVARAAYAVAPLLVAIYDYITFFISCTLNFAAVNFCYD